MKKKHRILAVGLLSSGILLIITPFLNNLWLLLFVHFLLGSILALNDVGASSMLMALWSPDEIGPYIQLLHFSFSLGFEFIYFYFSEK